MIQVVIISEGSNDGECVSELVGRRSRMIRGLNDTIQYTRSSSLLARPINERARTRGTLTAAVAAIIRAVLLKKDNLERLFSS